MKTTSDIFIDYFKKNFNDSGEAIVKEFYPLSEEQLNWKPEAKTWSIAECIEHVLITNRTYHKQFKRILEGERVNNFWSKIPFMSKMVTSMLLKTVNVDTKRKTKTLTVFKPSKSNYKKEDLFKDFQDQQQETLSFFDQLVLLDYHNIKLYSPATDKISYTIKDAFDILQFHNWRHFDQAKRVTQHLQFPIK